MNEKLMKLLEPVTEEEQNILNGNHGIEKEIYTTDREFTIDSRKMIEKGRLIDIRTHTRFVSFPEHRHNYIEIIYMCSGKTTHVIDRDSEITLCQGDLLFLNQFSSHEVMPAGKEDIGINFFVLPEFFDEVLPMLGKENVLSDFLIKTLRKNTDTASYLHFKVADVVPVQNLVENLAWSIMERQNNHRQINQTTMGLLFMLLVNYTDKIEQNSQDYFKSALALQVLKYIEDHYKSASLTELAGELNQSVSNLSKLVRSCTGHTFKELLQTKRLNLSLHLLCATSLPVTDIIYMVGYDNTSYFHRIFKEKFRMSPRDYRRVNSN